MAEKDVISDMLTRPSGRPAALHRPRAEPAPSRDLAPTSLERGTLYALALGTFAIGTEGFMIAAILPTISRSLDVSVPAAGQLVTVFALVYALSSPVLTALTGSVPRRRLLLLALGTFVLANLVAAAAPNYPALVGARVLLALSAGLFVPNATAVAGVLAPAPRRGRALAVVTGGITIAVAVGVPLGALVGANLGWRATFVGVSVLSATALAVLALRLPKDIPAGPPASIRARLAVASRRGVMPTLATTTLWATGGYLVYTYVAPYLALAAGLSGGASGAVLTLLGVSAMAGLAIGGSGNDRFGARRVQSVALPSLALAFTGLTVSALALAPHALPAIIPLVVLWGLSAWGFYPSQQDRIIRIAGLSDTPVALSLNASFMYLGFSLGAALGSVVLSLCSPAWIGVGGAACVVLAMGLSRVAWSRQRGMSVGKS